MNTVSIRGRISSDEKLIVSDLLEYKQFVQDNKNKRFMMTIMTYNDQSKDQLIALYYGKIVPDIRRLFMVNGDMKSDKQIDIMIRDWFPIFTEIKIVDGHPVENEKSIMDLDFDDMRIFIELLRIRIAEMFNVII